MKTLAMRFLLGVIALSMVIAPVTLVAKDNPMVILRTNMGDITVELYADKAPVSVQNFLWYVDNEFYDGLIFHRVMENFMIQGGGFTAEMKKKAGNPAIENEATNGLKNEKYTLAMARTSAVHSATSQFFINVKDNVALDHRNTTSGGFGYCVFGKVVDGMDVVDAIRAVEVASSKGLDNVPVKSVIIKKAWQKEDAKGKKTPDKEESDKEES